MRNQIFNIYLGNTESFIQAPCPKCGGGGLTAFVKHTGVLILFSGKVPLLREHLKLCYDAFDFIPTLKIWPFFTMFCLL